MTDLINQLKVLKETYGNSVDEIIAGLEPEVWVPSKNTPVMVWNMDLPTPRYSTGRLNGDGGLICYSEGQTSFSNYKNSVCSWKHWLPAPEAGHIINWIEHDGSGECPVDLEILYESVSSDLHTANPRQLVWSRVVKYITLESLKG